MPAAHQRLHLGSLRAWQRQSWRWLLSTWSCTASRAHKKPTTQRLLPPIHSRPFLAQPIAVPALGPPPAGKSRTERGRISSCLDLVLPQSQGHWQDSSGPYLHRGPLMGIQPSQDPIFTGVPPSKGPILTRVHFLLPSFVPSFLPFFLLPSLPPSLSLSF